MRQLLVRFFCGSIQTRFLFVFLVGVCYDVSTWVVLHEVLCFVGCSSQSGEKVVKNGVGALCKW